MKNIKEELTGMAILLLAMGAVFVGITGCMTSKVQKIDPVTGATNVVTVVNTNNLIIDASVIEATTATTVSILVQHNPSLVQPLRDTQTALDGIINGANTTTTAQLIALLKAQNNPALTTELNNLIGTVSQLEQNLLAKYGAEVGGQIATAILKAVDAGLIVGLQGH